LRIASCRLRIATPSATSRCARVALASSTVFVAAGLAAGCGGEFGETVRVAPERRTQVDGAQAEQPPIRLPADRPFNLVDARRSSSGGGQSESRADPSGTASCSAAATGGGEAEAEFQLGHVVENRSQQSADLVVRLHVDYACTFDGDRRVRDAAPDGFGLKFFVMDSDKRVYKRVLLAGLSDDLGPESWSAVQRPSFDLRLEPGRAYHLVLAGRVEVGEGSQPASARIDVNSLKMELDFRGMEKADATGHD